mgnify:CR=1 FL=1
MTNPSRLIVRSSARRLAATAVLALGLSVVAPVVSPATAAAPSFTPTNLGDTYLYGGCRPYILVGMRGSGEPLQNTQYGLGDDLYLLWDGLNTSGTKFRDRISAAVPTATAYPAVPVPISSDRTRMLILMDSYLQQVYNSSGTALMLSMVQVANRCPNSKLILAGYSQGAYSINYAMRRSGSTTLSKVAGTVLLADPAQSPRGALRVLKSYCATGVRPAGMTTAAWNELRTVSYSSSVCVRTRAATIYTAPSSYSFRYVTAGDAVADFAAMTQLWNGYLKHINYDSTYFVRDAVRWAQTGTK